MKNEFIFLFGIILLLNSCAIAMKSNRFQEASTSGALEIGMTKEEVRLLLGNPLNVSARKTTVDLREVWTYRDKNFEEKVYREDKVNEVLWGYVVGSTLGIAAIFMPPPDTTHLVVFSNAKLIGWDLADPYAPDLVIEIRER